MSSTILAVRLSSPIAPIRLSVVPSSFIKTKAGCDVMPNSRHTARPGSAMCSKPPTSRVVIHSWNVAASSRPATPITVTSSANSC